MADAPDEPPGPVARVPQLLADAAGWSWRLIAVGAVVYLVIEFLGKLELITIPFLTALLIASLLHPVLNRLRGWGLSRGLSAVVTVLLAFAVIGGVGLFVADRATAEYPQLVDDVNRTVDNVQNWLETGPLKIKPNSLNNLGDTFVNFLRDRQGQIAGGLVTAGRTVVDVVTAVVLTFFLTVFMLYDGDRIWGWVVRLFPMSSRERAHETGERAWGTLSGYITGTFTVALFHGVVMGTALAILGVPLVAPLAVLIFIGSFIPLIGAVVFGGLAVVVALLAKGGAIALVVLIVLVVENQVESHILQPFVVGRYVRLHPMAIAIVLTGGAVLAGVPGAIFGVPIVASGNAAIRYLSGAEQAERMAAPDLPPGGERLHWRRLPTSVARWLPGGRARLLAEPAAPVPVPPPVATADSPDLMPDPLLPDVGPPDAGPANVGIPPEVAPGPAPVHAQDAMREEAFRDEPEAVRTPGDASR